MSVIAASWVVSPLLAGLLSYSLFHVLKFAVLTRKNSDKLAIWILPVLVFITFFVNLIYILSKGLSKVIKLPITTVVWISAAAGGGAALLAGGIGIPLLMRAKKGWDEALVEYETSGKVVPPSGLPHRRRAGGHVSKSSMPDFLRTKPINADDKAVVKAGKHVFNFLTGGINADIFECVDGDETLKNIHDDATKYDPRTEQVFKVRRAGSARGRVQRQKAPQEHKN